MPTCPRHVRLTTVVGNVSGRRRRVRVRANFGGLSPCAGHGRHPAREPADAVTRRVVVTRAAPRTPQTPFLYPVTFSAHDWVAGRRPLRTVHTGLRSVRVRADGRLLLNGVPVNLRGVAVHDDLPGKGPALSELDRIQLVGQIKDSGSTLVRSHYPLSPAFERAGGSRGTAHLV